MANKLARFSNRDALDSIGKSELLEFLEPHRAYLEGRDVMLPKGPDAAVNLDKLSSVLMDPNEQTPQELSDALYYVTEMASAGTMDTLLDLAKAEQLELRLGPDPAPVDVAVRLWLKKPDELKDIHNASYLERVKSFISFAADVDPIPAATMPDAFGLAAMQEDLDAWFIEHKRGNRSKIFPYSRDDGHWFLIRHGETMKREGTYNGGTEGNTFYRPMKHDVVIYDPDAGQLRIHCGTLKERELYRDVFGLHLFGKKDFFQGDNLYTLQPILDLGKDCLTCSKPAGVDKINLTAVELSWPGEEWHRATYRASDIFGLFERKHLGWPNIDRIASATFSVLFTGQKKARTVTIQPSNKIKFQRIDDSPVLKTWMDQFIDKNAEEEDENPLE